MNAHRQRALTTFAPLVALGLAWLVLHMGRPRLWTLVPGGRGLGALIVIALALGSLVVIARAAREAIARGALRQRAPWTTFALVFVVLAVAQDLFSVGPSGDRFVDVALTDAYGPLVIWPALWVALPKVGLYALFPLGRVAILVATSAGLSLAGVLAFQAAMARRAAAATGAPLTASTMSALGASACPACAPPLFAAVAGLAGTGASMPLLAAMSAPGSVVTELLTAAGPVLAVGAVVAATRGQGAPDDRRGGTNRRTGLLVGAALLAGAVLALPLAALTTMPFDASPRARDVSALYDVVNVAGLAVLLAFELLLVGLVVANVRNEEADTERPTKQARTWATLAWVVVPALILAGIAVPAWTVLTDHARPVPGPAYVVHAEAMNWGWVFTHPDGNRSLDFVELPAGQTIQLRIESRDVVHSLYVPDLGIKMDAVPGRTNAIWFVADTPGEYEGVCAEFCGIGHPEMGFTARVV